MIGIIGAMEDEIVLLKQAMENIRNETVGAFEFLLGDLGKKPIVLLRCGIGKVNAAVGCAILINRYDPVLVINTGSAGGIDPTLSYGDVIISSGLVYHDADVTAFNYEPGQLPGQPAVFDVPDYLIRRAEQAVDELKKEQVLPSTLNHLRGIIGCGDVFMHDPDKISNLRKLFPDLKAIDMESTAIAHASTLFHIPAIIIRALSDIAGLESPIAFNEFLPVAVKHSAEIVRRIVRDY
jgi:adenosylhomocysteine nucleosidase